MTPLLWIYTLVTSCLCFAAGQTLCTTPKRMNGRCISISECPNLLKLIRDLTAENLNLLRDSLCETNEGPNRVCCPTNDCVTASGSQGNCVEIYSCPPMANELLSNTMDDVRQYARNSRCGDPAESKVCCDMQATISLAIETTQNSECQLTASPPDPSSGCCGVQASDDGPKIIGGNATALDEYPWLALLEYRIGDTVNLLCGGVLISGQYIVTAGHCLNETLTGVRLGEYDTENFGPDSKIESGGGLDWTDGDVFVPIEKAIRHPNYDRRLLINDIALIKLARIVQFTDFIRPICLPTVDFTTSWPPNEDLYAAGWGATGEHTSSNIKQKVRVPYVIHEECQQTYSLHGVQLWNGHICAGGENGKDSCNGVSGGPLMRITESRHELVGIVSFGSRVCGTEGFPGVYTKVFRYLPWIRSEIAA